ncbi:Maf family protein [Anaerosporobacter faecicola]|uniref:Maf family protein n=1 Tax=Anaerosporobacter faecicola TaxID=2718714 RepID=UPI0014393C7B|nr:Maf family protein [Anaerosporobacter faecicola]
MYNIILASGSPRRREILEQVGIPFTVKVSNKEEVITEKEPVNIVKGLASMKANDVAEGANVNDVIIGCDTIVSYHNQIMGKPKNEEDAKRMLQLLQNDVHEVYTGVSVIIKMEQEDGSVTDKEINFAVETKVYVNAMNEQQIDAYIATKEPMDKAGAYAVQGKFAAHIKKLDGDYYNVVGLPISKLYNILLEEGILTN